MLCMNSPSGSCGAAGARGGAGARAATQLIDGSVMLLRGTRLPAPGPQAAAVREGGVRPVTSWRAFWPAPPAAPREASTAAAPGPGPPHLELFDVVCARAGKGALPWVARQRPHALQGGWARGREQGWGQGWSQVEWGGEGECGAGRLPAVLRSSRGPAGQHPGRRAHARAVAPRTA
jgi:hypothetical protein